MSDMIPLTRIRAMLTLFPLDGLRKAGKTFALNLNTEEKDEKEALVDALLQSLTLDTLVYRKSAVDPSKMWQECHDFALAPICKSGTQTPILDQETKRALSVHIAKIIDKAGGIGAITGICAGKVSAATKKAEKSGYCKRWCDRYGQPETNYTVMRRLYRDDTSSLEYKARDVVALEVEKHAFDVIRQLFGDRASEVVTFSDEAGRQPTGKSYGPQWKVFVYLALQLSPPL